MDEFFTADDEQCGNTCETCKERSKLQHGKSKNPVWIQPLNMFVSPCEVSKINSDLPIVLNDTSFLFFYKSRVCPVW